MRNLVIELVQEERVRSLNDHGPFPQNMERQANLAAEELGEMIREINDLTRVHTSKSDMTKARQARASRAKVCHEAVQLANVAMQIVNFCLEDAECRKELSAWFKAVNGGQRPRERSLPL